MQEYSTTTTKYITKSLKLKSLVFEIPIVKLYRVSYFIYVFWSQYVILSEGVLGYPEMLEPSEVG